jgi:MtaA/CmuA family methyltransferase
MNSYERHMGMVRGETVDVVPRIPLLMHFAVKHADTTYDRFAADAAVFADAKIRMAKRFNLDLVDLLCDPWREASGFGGKITYMESTIPRCAPPLEHDRDLSLLQTPDPGSSKRMVTAIDVIRRFHDWGRGWVAIHGWVEGPAAEAADLRGVTNFMLDLIDDAAYAAELMSRCVDAGICYARAQIDAGSDTIGVGDAVVSQISPGIYERQIFAHEKRLVDAIHDAGALVRLHICGDITSHLPIIAQLGVDIIDIDWQVDMVEARRVLGPRVTLTGNLDPVRDVMNSTPDRIRAGFRDLYQKVGPPYFVNAGCEIPQDTPVENLEALCEPIPFG